MSVKIVGLTEAQERMRSVSLMARRSIIMPLLIEAAKPLAEAWASRIRRKSGDTAGQIAVRWPRKQVAGEDKASVVVNAGNRAHVARLLETGYIRRNKRTGTVSHIPRYPSAAAAFDSTRDEVAARIEAAMQKLFAELSR